MLDKELKSKIIKKFAKSDKDVGSIEVQLGLLTNRIREVAGHLKKFPKDKHSRVGLLKMVGKTRKFARYLKTRDKASFDKITKELKSI